MKSQNFLDSRTVLISPEYSNDIQICHRIRTEEGMNLPVHIQIPLIEENRVSDGMLYNGNIEKRLHQINANLAKEALVDSMYLIGLKMLNTILVQEYENVSRVNCNPKFQPQNRKGGSYSFRILRWKLLFLKKKSR